MRTALFKWKEVVYNIVIKRGIDPFYLKNDFTDFEFYGTIIKLEEPMPGIWTTPTGSWQLAIKK